MVPQCEKPGVSNNKGAHQPVHPRSLIGAFGIRLFESLIHLLQKKFQFLISVAEQDWFESHFVGNPNTGFLSLRREPYDLILQACGK